MSTVTNLNGIDIIVRSNDHCDPHVHALHDADRWEFKIFFSYVHAQIAKVEPCHGKPPKSKVIQACMDIVIDHLDECRDLFWTNTGSICMDNKTVQVVGNQIQVATKSAPGALLISGAKYIAATKSVEFRAHGSTRTYLGQCP